MAQLKQSAEVKAAANKKPYIKPDFEVINLEDTPKLLAASRPTGGVSGTMSHGKTLSNGFWD